MRPRHRLPAQGPGHLVCALLLSCAAGCSQGSRTFVPDAGTTCAQAPVLVAAPAPAGPVSDPGGCQKPVVASALPAGQVQSLGVHRVGDRVSFDVPAGTAGFTIVSQAVRAATAPVTFVDSSGVPFTVPNAAVPVLVNRPDGGVFYDDNDIPDDTTTAAALCSSPSDSTGVFTVPNTAPTLAEWQVQAPPGTWSFTVGDYAYECATGGGCDGGADATSTYDLSVLTRPAPVAAQGRLDLGLYLVTSQLTAAAAVHDDNARRMVATLATLLGGAGLCLGTVTFHDVPAWARSRFATGVDDSKTGPCDDLGQLFTLSQPGDELALFLVDEIVQGGGGNGSTTIGIDGSIPGPASLGGTVVSGAVVSAADLSQGTCGVAIDFAGCGPDETAFVAAHEAGHFLGLYHTSESGGDLFDPLTDTAECPCQTCAPPAARAKCSDASDPTQLTAAECLGRTNPSCGGAGNLMYWLLSQASTGALTAQQGAVLRANPAVR